MAGGEWRVARGRVVLKVERGDVRACLRKRKERSFLGGFSLLLLAP